MELEEKISPDNSFRDKLIDKLFELPSLKSLSKKAKQQIKMFIYENYVRSPDLVCNESIKELSEKNIRPEVGILIANAKICARDIIKDLDIESINSVEDVSNVVNLHLGEARKISNPF